MAASKPQAQAPVISLGDRIRELAFRQEGILIVIMAVAIVLIASQNVNFLKASNLLKQGRLLTEVGLIAIPMTFIIITGGIDLSVGSNLAMSAIIIGLLWQDSGFPLELATVIGLLVGTLGGFLNGIFIVRVGVPPLIMTLATLALFRGVAVGLSEARSARGFPEWFYFFGKGDILGIPIQIVLLVIAAVIGGVALARAPFGRGLYAVGHNETAARFAGIPVDRYKLIIYTLSGFMSALAGLILISRVTTTRSDMGTGMELDVIAAVVLGGTSIMGGSGTIAGTMIGVVLIQLLKNGLSLAGVKGDATIVVIGAVLIFSILANNLLQRRTSSV